MTELFEPHDTADPRLAVNADGLLAAFNAAGLLTSADVHVARRLTALAGDSDELVALAVALATTVVPRGSVGADLAAVRDLAPDLVRLFEGVELLEPGIVSCSRWRPETPVVVGEAYDYTQRNYRFPLRDHHEGAHV